MKFLKKSPKFRLPAFKKPRISTKDKVCLAIFGAIIVALGIYGWYQHRPAAAVVYNKTLPATTALESHMLVGGDIYWGRRMNDWSQQSPLKQQYPFSRLSELQKDKYDAWVANLECPAVEGIHQPIGFVPQLWEFNCDTDYMQYAAKWFDVFGLANNHMANQHREQGLEATRQTLNKYGIQHFGGFDPHRTSEICSVVAMPARARIDGKQQDVKLPVAMCGYHGVYYTITDKAIAEMEKYAKYMPVMAFSHMGREYTAGADDKRRNLYHKMIDHGADVVFGNHPHWVQPTEAYNGKLITYSLGNFIFDQQFSPEVMRAAAVDTTFTVDENAVTQDQLRAWVELGKVCGTPDDDCLQQAEAKQLARLPGKFKYDIIGIDLSQQITHLANQQLKDQILTRLNWQDTLSKLAK